MSIEDRANMFLYGWIKSAAKDHPSLEVREACEQALQARVEFALELDEKGEEVIS